MMERNMILNGTDKIKRKYNIVKAGGTPFIIFLTEEDSTSQTEIILKNLKMEIKGRQEKTKQKKKKEKEEEKKGNRSNTTVIRRKK